MNGEPSSFFSSSQGIREGDSLSPFLFVIVMVSLSRMMEATENIGLVARVSKGARNNSGLSVSHLLFVDDTLIFCGPNEDQLRNLRCLFVCFEAISGLKVNLEKFEIVPIGEVENVDRLARILVVGWQD
jgi:hypothetical protein